MKNSKIRTTYFIFLGLFVLSFLGFYPGDPPAGKTGAPGDGLCTDCHNTANPLGINGGIDIINFPSTITPGQTYMLTAQASNPNGIAVRAGFQAVVLNGSNQNAGDLFSTTSNPATQTSGGREYIEHRPALNFPGSNQVSWNFMWTAPTNANPGDGMTIYAASMIASGSNGEDSDLMVLTQANGIMEAGADPLTINITSTTDVACFGDATGTASALAAGGTGTYNYVWSNNQTGPTVGGFIAGTHSVTVTDSNNETAFTTFSISQPSQLNLFLVNQTDINCDNTAGTATVQANGGTPNYTYQWSGGGNGTAQTNLSPGSHTVTVFDGNLCEATISFNVGVDITPPNADAGPDKILTCQSASVTLGGTGTTVGTNIGYNWLDENGVIIGTSITVNVNAVGIYTLHVTNNDNGCSATDQVEVTTSPAITISLTGTDPTCPGATDGSIDLTITGGTSPFDIDWDLNTLDGIEDPTGLVAGLYSVTVTDDAGCSMTASETLTNPAPMDLNPTVQQISCNGICDGSIDINVTGGGPFDYSWTNGLPSIPNQSNLCPGDYSVTVTNGNNCSAMATFTIQEPTAINITSTTSNVSCFGSCDGEILLTVTGGTGVYNYDWSNGSPTSSITNLCAGTYEVTVTDSNGCTKTHAATITEPSELNLTITIENGISCNGSCDGELLATITGGTGGYNFDWDLLPDVHNPTNVCPGTYSLTVTDANNCFVTGTITLTEPSELAVTSTTTNITCSTNGSIEIITTGGTPAYTYDWDENDFDGQSNPTITTAGVYNLTVADQNGCDTGLQFVLDDPAEINVSLSSTGETSSNANDGTATAIPSGGTGNITFLWSNNETTNSIDNLAPGNYSVTVTDENDCTATGAVSVNSFDCSLSVSLAADNITCNGLDNGSVTATTSNGTAPYAYAWSNGESGATIDGLSPGNYSVTATDASNCESVASISINEPGVLQATATVIAVSCEGNCDGSIELEIIGGTSPYDITPNDLTDLCAGTYTLNIVDAESCELTLSEAVPTPDPLVVSLTATDVTSVGGADGTATATVSGGTLPHTFLWNDANATVTSILTAVPAGTYCVTVTDSNDCSEESCITINDVNCNMEGTVNTNSVSCNGGQDGTAAAVIIGGTGQLTYDWSDSADDGSIASDLPAGNQSVTITDEANCELILNFTIDQPLELTLEITHENESLTGANDGSAMAIASGGTGILSYNWSNSEQTADIDNLAPGEYCVVVNDENLCEINACVTILEGGCSLEASLQVDDVICNGASDGVATVVATGGVNPVTYGWSSSGNTNAIENGLSAGTYVVTVMDGTGCEVILPFDVTEPTALDLAMSAMNESTAGANDGSAAATATGGTGTLSYLWNTTATGATIDNLPPGEYCVTVFDENNCEESDCITVQSGGCSLVATIAVDNVSCFSGDNGSATVAVDGALDPVIYNWSSSGNTGNVETELSAGAHTVTVTDAANCEVVLSFTIVEPTEMLLTMNATHESAAGANDGVVAAVVSGGTAGYTYDWNVPNAGQPTLTGVSPGEYCVTVTDANNCSVESCATVNPAGCAIAVAMVSATPSCGSPCNGSIDVTVSGGVGSLVFDWSDPTIPDVANPSGLCPGTYHFTITDANGCEAQGIATVVSFSLASEVVTVDCGECAGSITLTAVGLAPYTYDWENNDYDGQSMLTDLCDGNYSCTVTDANGCQELFAIEIISPTELTATAAASPSCFEACDGAAIITVLGGSPPYQLEGVGANPNNLCPGNYETIITDANGCIVTASWEITELAETVLTVDEVGADVDGQSNGFINITVAGAAPFEFTWISGGMLVSMDEDPQNLTFGTYLLEVVDANGCSFISEAITVDMVTGTTDILTSGTLRIFPNPSTGLINVDFENWSSRNGQFQFYDSQGNNVKNVNTNSESAQTMSIDISEFAAGIYCLVYRTDDKVFVEKIMVTGD